MEMPVLNFHKGYWIKSILRFYLLYLDFLNLYQPGRINYEFSRTYFW